MENDLNYLIDNAIGCRNSQALADDKFIAWLEGIREAAAKCKADLAREQAAAALQINSLQSQIQELEDAKLRAKRELAMIHKQLEHDRKEIDRQFEKVRSLLAAA
jgi:hypothetical protein